MKGEFPQSATETSIHAGTFDSCAESDICFCYISTADVADISLMLLTALKTTQQIQQHIYRFTVKRYFCNVDFSTLRCSQQVMISRCNSRTRLIVTTCSQEGEGSKTLELKHICLLSLQQHHPLFCINGHPGVYGGDVRLSADRRRRQGGENRVQEILRGGGGRRVGLTWLSVSFHSFPPGGSSSRSPAVTTMLML